MKKSFLSTIFQRQPVERRDDDTHTAVRNEVLKLKRTVGSLEKVIEQLLSEEEKLRSGRK